jgi:hypothetical protein
MRAGCSIDHAFLSRDHNDIGRTAHPFVNERFGTIWQSRVRCFRRETRSERYLMTGIGPPGGVEYPLLSCCQYKWPVSQSQIPPLELPRFDGRVGA